MATSTSLSSLSGLGSGVDTTALINAIIAQKGTNVTRLQAQKDLNDKKTTALSALRTELSTMITSMAVIQDKFDSRTVTSTDANNTNVTATATGASAGNYDVTVHTVATKGRISSTLDANGYTTNLAVASPTDSVTSFIFTPSTQTTPATPAKFAIQGTDGVVKTITLTEDTNTLNGLRDAINASGAGVKASVVNMGKGDKPYQLVITASDTGTGANQGLVKLVDITNMATNGTAGAAANTLGIAAGGSTDGLTKTLTGGTTSATSGATAIDATFSLNGIELTRTTNVVKDAADGVTFTLKQGGQTGLTSLTVGPDKVAVTAAVSDFITKFNTLLKDYQTASTSTKNADGSINQAPLANDANTRALMANLKAKLVGASSGMASNATYKTLASLGVTTQTDGTLYLNANTLQNALVNDISSAQNLFLFSGTSTNQVVTLKSGGPQTATGPVSFTITKDGTGALSGTLTQNNVTSDPIAVSNGTLVGTGSYAGLVLNVTGAGTGTLNLTRGAGQAAADLLSSFTSTAAGSISSMLTSITNQNNNLSKQIAVGQAMLDQEKKNLTKKFADMEAAVGAMKSAAGSLSGA